MNTLFYLNNNRKDAFTIKDVENGKLIFEDDLIWCEGLVDWTLAKNVKELNHLLKRRPPISKKQKQFKLLKRVFSKSFLGYLIISILIGVSAALLENMQYDRFYSEIKESFEKNEIERVERIKVTKTQKIRIEGIKERNRLKEEERIDLNEKINRYSNWTMDKYEEWRREENNYGFSSRSYDLLDELNNLNEKVESFKNQLSKIGLPEIEPIMFGQSDKIGVVEHNLPHNEIYVRLEDNSFWTRWCAYNGDINQNENVSYNSCHKFLFRPYYAIFSVANLSQEEQGNMSKLLLNFTLSSLVSNLPILVLIFIWFYRIERRELRA